MFWTATVLGVRHVIEESGETLQQFFELRYANSSDRCRSGRADSTHFAVTSVFMVECPFNVCRFADCPGIFQVP